MESKRTSTLMILLRPMIKLVMIWQLKDLQTRRNSTCKIKFKTRMEHIHTLMTQLNTKKPERDFKIESQLLEADKERRVTKRNSNKLLMIKMRSLINWHERIKTFSKRMLVYPVKTKFSSNKWHTSRKHLLTPALLAVSNNHRYQHHRKRKTLLDKKILTFSSLKSCRK
jgi:hypothetical protein